MAKKTVKFNSKGIKDLPNDKPVVYKILTQGGNNNYTGIAQRGRIQERLQEHLSEGNITGTRVQIDQMESIGEARKKESRIIKRTQPKYNNQGK